MLICPLFWNAHIFYVAYGASWRFTLRSGLGTVNVTKVYFYEIMIHCVVIWRSETWYIFHGFVQQSGLIRFIQPFLTWIVVYGQHQVYDSTTHATEHFLAISSHGIIISRGIHMKNRRRHTELQQICEKPKGHLIKKRAHLLIPVLSSCNIIKGWDWLIKFPRLCSVKCVCTEQAE